MNRKIGYARIPSKNEEVSSQIRALKKAGCTKIFFDEITGCRDKWPQLHECLTALKPGDVLIVERLDRMACSMPHLATTISDLCTRGVHVCSLEDSALDTRKASGRLVAEIFANLVRFQTRLSNERTRKGRSAARARGRMGGRKAVAPDDPKIKLAKKLSADHSISINEICARLKISRSSYYRYLGLGAEVNR